MAKLTCNVCSVDKGRGFTSYIAIVKRDDAEKFGLSHGSGLLLRCGKSAFPVLLVKRGNSKGSFSYAFSIPAPIAKGLGKVEKFLIISRPFEFPEKYIDGLDLAKILPQKTLRGAPFFVFPFGRKILIWIAKKGNREVVFPRKLDTKKELILFELLGAYFCEGRMTRKSDRHHLDLLSFSNAEESEINWFAKVMAEVFGIEKSDWTVQILHPNPSERIKKIWSKQGFVYSKIRIYKNPSVKAPHGVALLQIYGTTIAEVFQSLLGFAESKSIKSKAHAISFFRGITRGDVGVIRKKGRISSINFSAATEEDAHFFCKLCKRLGISTSKIYFIEGKKGCWSVFITGYDNFRKLVKLNAITHPRRLVEFSRGMIESKKSNIYHYLSAIDRGFVTSRQLAEKLNLSIITTRFYAQMLRKKGFIRQTVVDKETKAIRNELTQKGVELLGFYDKIKENSK
jgi:predicted transcriptional regulator